MTEENTWRIRTAPIGAFVTFAEDKKPYRIRARSGRFIVCTRPYSKKKTVYYTVIDLVEGIRGPENLVFGMGAESDDDCWNMVDRLDGRDNNHPKGRDAVERPLIEAELKKAKLEDIGFQQSFRSEVTYRNRIPLDVVKVRIPKTCQPW